MNPVQCGVFMVMMGVAILLLAAPVFAFADLTNSDALTNALPVAQSIVRHENDNPFPENFVNHDNYPPISEKFTVTFKPHPDPDAWPAPVPEPNAKPEPPPKPFTCTFQYYQHHPYPHDRPNAWKIELREIYQCDDGAGNMLENWLHIRVYWDNSMILWYSIYHGPSEQDADLWGNKQMMKVQQVVGTEDQQTAGTPFTVEMRQIHVAGNKPSTDATLTIIPTPPPADTLLSITSIPPEKKQNSARR